MLLTASSGRGAASPALTALLLPGTVALAVTELGPLLLGRRLQLGPHHVPHRLDPVGDDLPLLAVPLLDEQLAVGLVVLAGDRERPGEALHAQLLQPLVGEVQVLEAPPDLLAG